MTDEIVVSICCITYNHGKYIGDALEGFINQKTSFKYEVLIHDDASTDDTADIIKAYEKKYPNIIKPILQTENQYSKHILINNTFNFPRAKGKYIAICEGDDYWQDICKLEKQVHYMNSNDDCTFCFSNAIVRDERHKEKEHIFVVRNENNENLFNKEKLDVGDVAELGFLPTASYLLRRDVFDKLPSYYDTPCPGGDLKMALYFTAFGYAHFIDEPMTVYRSNVPGSSLDRWSQYNREQRREHHNKFLTMIDNVDYLTDYKFSSGLDAARKPHYRGILMAAESREILADLIYKNYYDKMRLKDRVQFWCELIIPEHLIIKIKNIKNHRL